MTSQTGSEQQHDGMAMLVAGNVHRGVQAAFSALNLARSRLLFEQTGDRVAWLEMSRADYEPCRTSGVPATAEKVRRNTLKWLLRTKRFWQVLCGP